MDYFGTWYIDGDSGQNYIGFVFSYQSNRKFYVVLWRQQNYNYNSYGGIKGIQIKVRWACCLSICIKVEKMRAFFYVRNVFTKIVLRRRLRQLFSLCQNSLFRKIHVNKFGTEDIRSWPVYFNEISLLAGELKLGSQSGPGGGSVGY